MGMRIGPARGWLTAFLLILVIIGSVCPSSGGQPAKIAGTVRDAETDQQIALANVSVSGTLIGDATDAEGRFEIVGLPAGPHVILVTVIGYRKASRQISLEEGQALHLDFYLEPTAIEIPPVVVTASRREEDLRDAPVTVSVLSTRDIEKRDVVSPDEILKLAPGVVVTESQAGIRGSSGFNRGAGSRLLLLVDGVPALAGDTGDIKWDLIPAGQIERIEIVKSASSSLYGSSALGGVINLVTRPVSDTPETRFRLTAGYFDDPYYPEWKWTSEWLTFGGIDVSHTRKVGKLGVFTAFSRNVSDGYRRNSEFERSAALAKVTYAMTESRSLTGLATWALEKYGHSTEWKSQNEALDVAQSSWQDEVASEKLAGYLKIRNLMGIRSLVSATLNWYLTDWKNDFHDAQDNARARRIGGSVQYDRAWEHEHKLTLGVDGWQTEVTSTMFGSRQIGEIGLFAEARTRISERVSLTTAARYDAHYLGEKRDWASLLSPRAGFVVKAGGSSTFNISAGRGFRAPTVAEMFTSTSAGGFTVKPNPDLASERGTTYEIAWTATQAAGMISAGLFRSDYRQLIEPEVDPADGRIHFANVADAKVSGAEVWLRTAPVAGLLGLNCSYMYLSTEDQSTGDPLAYRSKNNLKVSAEIGKPGWLVGVDFIYRSRVERVKVYENDQRVPIYVTDLRGEIRLSHLRLAVKVANLFQYNYTEIERTLAPIRHIRFTLSGVY
jgi:outer membrane receptor for ferrienterochelin and colicins